MPLDVEIRRARSSDAETIAEFNRLLAAETEAKELDWPTLLAGVNALIADSAHGAYYVAELGGQIVGQLLITFEWSDWRNGQFWWIQSVYVAPAHRRAGIFRALYRHVETAARESGSVCGLRLYVESDNQAAQETYRSLGMTMNSYQLMEIEFEPIKRRR